MSGKDKNAEVFGWVLSILLAIGVFILFVSVPIFLNFGVVYLLSTFPIVEFHFHAEFWSNFWFFLGFTVVNIIVLALSELLITVGRKRKANQLSDLGPANVKEWALHLVIFTVYMNVFDIYFDRLDTTLLGSALLSLSIVLLYNLIEMILNKLQDNEEESVDSI